MDDEGIVTNEIEIPTVEKRKETGTKNIAIWVTGGGSILYIALILFFRGNDAWVLFRAGNLNELGDFLAGFFTPLAFGWLVYGYLLQSKELRLQREELTLTRNQLGKQTELLQEQVAADHRASRPHLNMRLNLDDSRWEVENKGGDAKNIELLNRDEVFAREKSLARNASFYFELPNWSGEYEARFSSERSERFYQRWVISQGKCRQITNGPQLLATEK